MPTPPSPAAAGDSSYYRRPLPEGLVAFASAEGRRLFREALDAGDMEGWFALSEQFHTQADPAYCGLGTLVVVLNALEIDPGRVWKGPWRWYGEELLDCCLPLEQIRSQGVTLDQLACLARCNGASTRLARADATSLEELRREIRAASRSARGPVVVASYSRRGLGQTGEGHFSPVAGYHAGRDLALILDVARFKYPPHWVPLSTLWEAMRELDPATGKTRGFMVLERGQPRLLPLLLRIGGGGDGNAEQVAAVLADAPALLAEAAGSGDGAGGDVVAGWIAAVERRLAAAGCTDLRCGASARPLAFPAEHAAAVEGLLTELRATGIHRSITAARGESGSVPGGLSSDVLATLLLALPDTALATLPPTARTSLEGLRGGLPPDSLLAAEIADLREQLDLLRDWK